MITPEGLGLYVRRLAGNKHGTPRDLAAKFSDHGLEWVAIAGPWHDEKHTGNANDRTTVAKFAEAFLRAGVDPWLWGYPWFDRVDLFVDQMASLSTAAIRGWILDPELGLKGHPAEAERLVDRAVEYSGRIGWTSYGLIDSHCKGKNAFPIKAFVNLDFGSPQCYTEDKRIDEALEQWQIATTASIIPSFGLYQWTKRADGTKRAIPKTPDQLRNHLAQFVSSPVRIEAMIGWELAFLTKANWKVLETFADWLRRGACALPL